MLPPLKYPFLILILTAGLGYSTLATENPAFQESLSWAREHAAQIKDQISGVDTSFSNVELP